VLNLPQPKLPENKSGLGTFNYYMTLREGFAQTVRLPSYDGKGFGQIVI